MTMLANIVKIATLEQLLLYAPESDVTVKTNSMPKNGIQIIDDNMAK